MAMRILVVDDSKPVRWSLREALSGQGYEVLEAADGASARRLIKTEEFDLALLDLHLPDDDGMALLALTREQNPAAPVVFTTAHPSVESAVAALRAGASDYLTKPFDEADVLAAVGRALDRPAARSGQAAPLGTSETPFDPSSLIGESRPMQELKRTIERIAGSQVASILLLGETGAGKDLVARIIHYGSSLADRPFINITCTALQETLLESELFGHEKGAFTDAKEMKRGLFELADGGTVYLDEIGDMSPALQAKLLRVLEEKAFRRIGGTLDINVKVRVIAATNRDLEQALNEGAFREDLYYRLSTVPVLLPPLRERREDIPLLADHFLRQNPREFHRAAKALTPEALDKLRAYDWPGNVRELRNVLERATLLSAGDRIGADDITLGRPRLRRTGGDTKSMRLPEQGCDLAAVERELLIQALDRAGGNQTKAGELLGISRDQVRYKIGKYGLE